MNPERFDALARTLATSTSRRATLKAAAAAVLGGLVGGGVLGALRVRAGSGTSTTIMLTNSSDAPVTVYLTLNSYPDSILAIQDVTKVFSDSVTWSGSGLQGSFCMPTGSVSYSLPGDTLLGGNFSFGTPPLNCPTSDFTTGINPAELTINAYLLAPTEGPDQQDSVDISSVTGVNADVLYQLSGGTAWNAGPQNPNVTSFENNAATDNANTVGVYPWGCTNCTNSQGEPSCTGVPPSYGNNCSSSAVCQVQRYSAQANGGQIGITFKGFMGLSPTFQPPTCTPPATPTPTSTPAPTPTGTPTPAPTGTPPTGCGQPGQACCSGDTCTGGTVCASGTCSYCGAATQPCCADNKCNDANVCSDGTCLACGAAAQPCCQGNTCRVGTCTDNVCKT